MGIPAAPDVENLYLSYFEHSIANDFLLCKRYIDDFVCLVEADSKKAALEQCAKVHADGLTLTWSVEETAVNFLDLMISLEAGHLSFKPYRKPLNNCERLPSTCAHPLHLKELRSWARLFGLHACVPGISPTTQRYHM